MRIKKSIKKRFKFTKKGKILRRKAGQDHSLAKKSKKFKRKLKKLTPVNNSLIF